MNIRLITPTDPEGMEEEEDSVTQTEAGQKYFQLTHDYPPCTFGLTTRSRRIRLHKATLSLFLMYPIKRW